MLSEETADPSKLSWGGGNPGDRVHLGEIHSQWSTGKAGRELLGWRYVIVADERGSLKMRELVQYVVGGDRRDRSNVGSGR